jgi:hypothetical protein
MEMARVFHVSVQFSQKLTLLGFIAPKNGTV